MTVKNFLEYCGVDVNPRRFKIKVRLPKALKSNKGALSKDDIIEILNQCSYSIKNLCFATGGN